MRGFSSLAWGLLSGGLKGRIKNPRISEWWDFSPHMPSFSTKSCSTSAPFFIPFYLGVFPHRHWVLSLSLVESVFFLPSLAPLWLLDTLPAVVLHFLAIWFPGHSSSSLKEGGSDLLQLTQVRAMFWLPQSFFTKLFPESLEALWPLARFLLPHGYMLASIFPLASWVGFHPIFPGQQAPHGRI